MATKKEMLAQPREKALAKPKLTAEQRRVKREAERQAVEEQRRAAAAEFERMRPLIWQSIWVKALRLQLILLQENVAQLVENYGWWFSDFAVNPWQQAFTIHTLGGRIGGEVSEAKLYAADVERLNDDLDEALGWYEAYLAQKERERLEALERQRKREAALAKLTAEDKEALGLARF